MEWRRPFGATADGVQRFSLTGGDGAEGVMHAGSNEHWPRDEQHVSSAAGGVHREAGGVSLVTAHRKARRENSRRAFCCIH